MMTTIRTRNPRGLKKRPRMRFFPPMKKSKAPTWTKDPVTSKWRRRSRRSRRKNYHPIQEVNNEL